MATIAVVASLISIAGCSSSSLDAATQSKIDADVTALMSLRHVNGGDDRRRCHNGETVYAKGYGMRDAARNLPGRSGDELRDRFHHQRVHGRSRHAVGWKPGKSTSTLPFRNACRRRPTGAVSPHGNSLAYERPTRISRHAE